MAITFWAMAVRLLQMGAGALFARIMHGPCNAADTALPQADTADAGAWIRPAGRPVSAGGRARTRPCGSGKAPGPGAGVLRPSRRGEPPGTESLRLAGPAPRPARRARTDRRQRAGPAAPDRGPRRAAAPVGPPHRRVAPAPGWP